MNDQEIDIVVFTIDNILKQPNLLESTKRDFVSFKNKFLSKEGTQEDVKRLNDLIELKNKELIATYGLLELGKDIEAADILTSMKKRKFEDI